MKQALKLPNSVISKDALRQNCAAIAEAENVRASIGILPDLISPTSKVHHALVVESDYRKGFALGQMHKGDSPLTYARSLIQRGHLKDAKLFLSELTTIAGDDHLSLSFIKFEQTRIAFFESDWHGTIQFGQKVSELKPPSATLLALFQLEANAHFELGHFEQAYLDLEKVEALGILFPHALSLLYAQMLSVRLLARQVGPESAERRLNQIMAAKLRDQKCDNDILFSYFRTKMDINRVKGVSALNESFACYLLSVAAGDKLYAGLALLDIYCEFGANPPELLLSRLELIKKEFTRVQYISDEMHSNDPMTVTGQTMKRQRQNTFVNSSHRLLKNNILTDALDEHLLERYTLLAPTHFILAQLKPQIFQYIAKKTQLLDALIVLSEGPISKEKFFNKMWGSQKYTPRLHDTLISSLLHRFKKDLKLSFRVDDQMVLCDKEIVVIS